MPNGEVTRPLPSVRAAIGIISNARARAFTVGNMLQVTNPVTSLVGEGDEKIYLDGERFPSTFGTGTEDYYGYGWCDPVKFTHAYHNQSRCDGPNNYGNTCLSRFHVIDALPFNTSFKFDMEVWTHSSGFRLGLAQTSYWYAMAGSRDNFTKPTPSQMVVPTLPTPTKVAGVIEAEPCGALPSRAARCSPRGTMSGPTVAGNRCGGWRTSRGNLLNWGSRSNRPGAIASAPFIRLGSPAVFTAFLLNGCAAASPRDMFDLDFKISPEEMLGEFELKAGENILKVECLDKNPKAIGYLFTLDYLKLVPVQ